MQAHDHETAGARGPRIVIFDCETTGVDCTKDQIIELCIQRGLEFDPVDPVSTSQGASTSQWPTSQPTRVTWRIRPGVEIHPAAQAVHGIAAADLDACPSFADVADEIAEAFATADIIVGYNVAFDLEMLRAEYARLERTIDLTGKQFVDAFRLWQRCEPRSLQHAHQRFVGNEFAAAHSAPADVAATGRVLTGMLKHFKLDEPLDWNQIATVSDPNRQK